jgi:DnaJ-class molecular chaperone
VSAPRDYYEVLGVSRTASGDEIKAAHRRLAKKLHPDMNKAPDAPAKFNELQEAFGVLSDAEKRAAYDRFGHAGVGAGGSSGGDGSPHGGPRGQTAQGQWRHVDVGDFSEVFSEVFGGDGSFADGMAGGRRGARGPGQPVAGRDVESQIEVDFMAAALGCTRTISMEGQEGEERFDVRIPPGIEDGGRLRLRGKGRAGRRGGPPGDLLLAITVHRHPWFRREGLDILLDVPITIVEAALGTTVRIPLLRGSVALKAPAGTSSGTKLRVRGRGIDDGRGGKGDFYAVIAVVAPRDLTPADADLLRQIGEGLPDPRATMPWVVEDQVA